MPAKTRRYRVLIDKGLQFQTVYVRAVDAVRAERRAEEVTKGVAVPDQTMTTLDQYGAVDCVDQA